MKAWNRWLVTLDTKRNLSLQRWYFSNSSLTESQFSTSEWQLHAFSDASNETYGRAVDIIRRTVNAVNMSLVFGKSRIILKHQQNWPIAKKSKSQRLLLWTLCRVHSMHCICLSVQNLSDATPRWSCSGSKAHTYVWISSHQCVLNNFDCTLVLKSGISAPQ